MREVDFMLQWTEDLKNELKSLDFEDDDIRRDYFRLTYDIANIYYLRFILLDFSDFINDGRIVLAKEILSYKVHVNRVVQTGKSKILTVSYFNSLNRSLLIDAWSIFELCVSTYCDAICSEDERKKLLESQYNEIVKEIDKTKINGNEDIALRKLTIKNHMTHVPVIRKTDFLFKKSKGYGGNKEKDKEFLKFFGKFRNTLHTNFVYYGKDYNYQFGDANFIFKNNKIVKWKDPFSPDRFRPSPELYFYLVGQIKNIWKELIKTIEYPNLIEYPDKTQL